MSDEDDWENFEEREEEEEKKAEEEAKKKAEEEAKKKPKKTKDLLAERDRKDREREQRGVALSKADQQRMVEEQDFRNAQDMFGDLSTSGELDHFVPKTDADFVTYSKMLCDRATPFAASCKPAQYREFVVTLCKGIVEPMKVDDIRAVIAALNSIVNDKIKNKKKEDRGDVQSVAARQKQKQQEQRAKAMALKQLDEEEIDEDAEDEYSRYEDKYDFM